ncbi:UDP-glucose:glycoprotein glucosyltransferase 1 [Aplysia californica]|uniref:UDP-glucose:glycoprotein glucosyltransferase 1 n=1 Tax=Aplysia californica TaxID=6500 RepID=A0ABM1VUM1_APLCA|nr:UDP-glucose:glycoprotein glucosyltransferase 1 [Aplysia californica]XP_035826113.1 UDP-glucose:glycoprotein glucosyltransferase 1 [Aplysia californica]
MARLFLQGIAILLMIKCYVDAKQKPVNIALSGKWNSTPLLLEASEFLAKESAESFWTFVGRIADQDPDSIQTAADDIKYKLVQKFASELLSPLQLSFLKFSLALRAYSPAVNMYQQIVEQIEIKKDCSSFIDVNGKYTCDTNEMSELLTTAITRSPSPLYQFDHIYPNSGKRKAVVILYAEIGTKGFLEFHPALSKLASGGEITYVLRHFIKNQSPDKVRLSGYGVELSIKSTEYKAKDDTKVEGGGDSDASDDEDDGEEVDGIVFSKLKELHPDLKAELKEFRNHLMDSATELTPFKVWQLQDLSYQASQRIVSAPPNDALQFLQDISQNFPTLARSLVRTAVSTEFKREVKKNKEKFEFQNVGAGESLLYLNGLSVDMEIYDVFTLLDVMVSEARLVEGLHALGFKGNNLQKFLQLDLKEGGDDMSYAVDIRHSAIQYLNDLGQDKKYRTWPNSIQDLLRPTFPGMLRHIAKNIFHLVFVVDPLDSTSKSLLKMAEAFYVHKAPLRLGIAFVVNSDPKADGFTDAGIALVRAYTFVSMDKGAPAKGLSFITDVYEKAGTAELTADAVIAEFALQYPGEDKDLVFGKSDDYDDVRKAGNDFVSRSGLSGMPQVLINGVPLDQSQLGDNFEESVVIEVLKQTQVIQSAVYKGEVNDRTDIMEWWMERDNVLPRLNSRVLAPPAFRVDLTGSAGEDRVSAPALAAELSAKDLTSAISDGLVYLTKREEESVRPVTMWVVADLETSHGRELMYNAIKHVKVSNDLRLSVVFNSLTTKIDNNSINRAVWVALRTLPMPLAKSLVTKLVKEDNAKALLAGTKTLQDLEVHGMDIDKYIADLSAQNTDFLKVHGQFASRVLSLRPGEKAIVTNGAVLGPIGREEELSVEDVNLMERLAYQQAGKKVAEAVSALPDKKEGGSDLVMKVCGLLTSKDKREKRHKIDYYGDKYSVVKIPADSSIPAFTVEAILDPVSREAQKMTPILMVLQQIANVDIRIYLNPREKLSEMPLKNFYRFVLEPEITFDGQGSLSKGPSARFLDLPQKSLLTLSMDTPESWMVGAVTSPYDLDNILLEEVEKSVSADFELEYILMEGHCSDATTMQPPRGLQFVLGTDNAPSVVDTIVMANLGYFQLKANPGLWTLNLRDGRSKEIYNIESHENTDSPLNSSQVFVAINSFKSKIIRVKVAKKPDKMDKSLLSDDGDEGAGLWDSISSTLTGSGNKEEEKDTTLNIFSVASGHLYERFLRIMMLSVLKNTQSKVKFWFLKNYLSPSFKDFIPYMAQEYGFEYELVQYKWPRWLNQQKEKQRIIWGYKILFLDVLFPLDVKKIIFVDADQIVRADLQELHDLDLGGAPYGYTPFCDSRKEMDGFRFWRSGYWKSHLAGRKYHISALYVVDLKRFRRIAAGDRLRGQYQGLSQDPNSLANLDQDLPNNMIHQVAIKSLPQEWLYCETWCDVSEKPKAKTIDLCNNPLTKEPKLAAAMRIVPEWKDYDYEVKVLWDDIYHTNTKEQIEYEPPQLNKKSDTKRKEEL